MAERQDRAQHDEAASDARRDVRTLLRSTRMRVVLGVALVLLLVGVPAYLTTRPAYLGGLPGAGDEYRAWTKSTHAEVECDDCHVGRGLLDQVGYRARMVGEFYLTLVLRDREPDVFARPSNASCVVCHSELRSVSPEGDVQIPHRAHIEILKIDCVECHRYVTHQTSPEGRHTPPMSGCLTCHDGVTAKDDCSACHTDKAAPKSHAARDWLVVHARDADDPACPRCHKWAERWCADCHSQRPKSHTKDWRSVHGARVAIHRGCEACHAGPFCERCHGEVPRLNLDPDLKLIE